MSCHRPSDDDAQKLAALRAKFKAGICALDRGDFVEIDEAQLEDYLERLIAAGAPHLVCDP